ncbi:uncharacterized protein LOC127277019 [Leptopilina boulardi]|uniref:uncharacterized protein LOC127277019 n=1 Tax=Leptopilina boulardi TaxID=63433 RepID=UPI0021F6202D|nr:uncharacterized protein LOC127277019 [Leptopilina boulardi]
MWMAKRNTQKKKPPEKRIIPVKHYVRDKPISPYKGSNRCYDLTWRYHKTSKFNYDEERQQFFQYMQCSETKTSINCNGTARLFGKGTLEEPFDLVLNKPHNNDCKEKYSEGLMTDDLCTRSHSAVGNHSELFRNLRTGHPEALANTSFVNKQSTMRRHSSQDYEPIKNDFGLFAFYLNGESWQKRMTFNLKVDGDEMDSKIDKSFKFNVFEVEDASKDIAVVLIPNDFIPELLLATYAFTDATYQTVPQIVGAYQVLTLLVEIKSKVVPIMYSVMSRKAGVQYDVVFETMKNNGLQLFEHLQTVVTDFEPAERNAVREVLNLNTQGCRFHSSKV